MGNSINIQETIEKARKQIEDEPNLSPALKTTFELLINLCLLLAQKWLPKDSKNSNLPPSADVNREKTSKVWEKRKPSGQAGHPGASLKPVDTPDQIVPLLIDRHSLPGENCWLGEAASHRLGSTAGGNGIPGGDSGERTGGTGSCGGPCGLYVGISDGSL
jgi:hypothetical protein